MAATKTATPIPARSADPKVAIEHGYDAVASEYLAWSAPRPTLTRAAYLDKLLAHLKPGAKVLELGCGAGVPCTQKLVAHGLNVIGVDISTAQVELGRKHVPGAEFVKADMMSLEYDPRSFDAVLAFYSIFHLPKEEQGTMIERISSWLKDGGWFLCNFSNDEGDVVREGWFKPEVTMFSSGLGVQGTRTMLDEKAHGLVIVEDELAVEKVGRFEEYFHWIFARKQTPEEQAHKSKD
jgi:ubiquinone/menaquinone biosynthesis C-methylase UbiE